MMNCRRATRLVSESQERKLSTGERIGLGAHLMMCSGCRNFSRQIPFLREAMRGFAQGGDAPDGKPDASGK